MNVVLRLIFKTIVDEYGFKKQNPSFLNILKRSHIYIYIYIYICYLKKTELL